ncbi:MAG: DUF998 domain-containing protein [Thermoplasmatota archaeon]
MQWGSIRIKDITKVAGICGILIPIVIFTGIGLAMVYSPWFEWTNHALSDLGVEGVSAFFFNNAMILGGVLTFMFSLGLMRFLSNKTGAYLLCASSLALIGIGLIPETIFYLHFFYIKFILYTVDIVIYNHWTNN